MTGGLPAAPGVNDRRIGREAGYAENRTEVTVMVLTGWSRFPA